MGDVPQDDIARPIRTSGFLASALFEKDRHTSDVSTTVDRNFWHTGSSLNEFGDLVYRECLQPV
jgi:hypothetical protein